MTTRLLLLALVVIAMCGCASGQHSASESSGSPAGRTRCLVNPSETGTRPLVFLFCIESP